MPEIDQWILLRAEDLVARCRAWYENYEFHKVYHTRLRFCHGRSERRLFRRAERPALHFGHPFARRAAAAQTALYRLLDALVRLLAPIVSFTAEEVWTHMKRRRKRPSGSISRSPASSPRAWAKTHGNGPPTGTV